MSCQGREPSDPGVPEQRPVTSEEGHSETSEASQKQRALSCCMTPWVSGKAERLSRPGGPCCPGVENWGGGVVGIPPSHFLLAETDRGIPG